MNKLNTEHTENSWGTPLVSGSYRLPRPRLCATDYDPLRSTIPPFFKSSYCPLIQTTLPEFAYEVVLRYIVKILAEVHVHHHADSCVIVEHRLVAQTSNVRYLIAKSNFIVNEIKRH